MPTTPALDPDSEAIHGGIVPSRVLLPFALLLVLLLSGCGPKPVPASPALWEVSRPSGGKGWLFGTIHALDRPALWRGAKVGAALDAAGSIMVEVADLDDEKHIAATFAALATSKGHPPLSRRVPPAMRSALARALKRHGLADDGFATTETWAAALTLAQAGTPHLDTRYGIDRAVIAAAGERPVVELEGAEAQLAIFDRLPESEQRDLLAAVVTDAEAGPIGEDSPALARAWRQGDMAVIARETERGLLADPELRDALFTGRNRAWTARIAGVIDRGGRPFVAVGAAHLAGPEGLPAMLKARGYTVRRVQ